MSDYDHMASMAHAEWAAEEQQEKLRARIAELEQQLQGLRARCEGLAERWTANADFISTDGEPGTAYVIDQCADELRALLRGEGETNGSG